MVNEDIKSHDVWTEGAAVALGSGDSQLFQNGTGFLLQNLSRYITLFCLIIFMSVLSTCCHQAM